MKKYIQFLLFLLVIVLIACDNQGESKQDQSTKEAGTIDAITQKITEDSSNAVLWSERAMAHLKKKNHNQAMRDMLTAIDLQPDNASFFVDLSDIYISMGLLDNCLEALDKASALDPENVESMLKLSEINLLLKKYREAIQSADKAADLDKTNPLPHVLKGFTFAEAGDTLNSIKSYLDAIARDQSNYDAYMQLGLIYSTKSNRLAIDYFNNALNIDPQSAEALYGLGMFYQESGDVESAISTYNRLLVVDPQNVHANYNLGYVNMVFLGEYSEAIPYFAEAIRLKPDYFEAVYNKGYCHELIGEYDIAREHYNKALEIEVNYDKAIEGLNRIYGK